MYRVSSYLYQVYGREFSMCDTSSHNIPASPGNLSYAAGTYINGVILTCGGVKNGVPVGKETIIVYHSILVNNCKWLLAVFK
jgi:hypothetical protein